jgi:hypothetical protein
MEKLNGRFIDIVSATQKEFENYMAYNFSNQAYHYTKEKMPHIPPEKRRKTVMIMGLPFNVTAE